MCSQSESECWLSAWSGARSGNCTFPSSRSLALHGIEPQRLARERVPHTDLYRDVTALTNATLPCIFFPNRRDCRAHIDELECRGEGRRAGRTRVACAPVRCACPVLGPVCVPALSPVRRGGRRRRQGAEGRGRCVDSPRPPVAYIEYTQYPIRYRHWSRWETHRIVICKVLLCVL